MTPRERNMVIGLLATILIGGGAFGGYTLVYTPLEEANASIQLLEEEIKGTSEKPGLFDRVDAMRKSAAEAALVKRQSLPLNVDLAKNQYKLLLERLFQQARIETFQIPSATQLDTRPPLTPDLGNKKPAFTRLGFKVKLNKVDIWQLTDFLYEFYELDLLHQITEITITRENKPTEVRSGLEVQLSIEAIILDSAEPKLALFPVTLAGNNINKLPELTSSGEAVAAIGGGRAVPAVAVHPELSRKVTALANAPVLATRPRDYSLLAQKDIFYGILPDRPPPGLMFAKIPDIQINMEDKKIPEVKVSVLGDGAENAKITAMASGSMIPEGPLQVDPNTNTISFPPVKEGLTSYAYVIVTVNAISDNGREGKAKFEVKFNRPPIVVKGDDL
ncbi:MAG TPA: hypothetical protein VG097_00055, partial [Gemmata sp.]|nr:hypothetical protein [Gemmata sp.]